jgi:hypothetical protein
MKKMRRSVIRFSVSIFIAIFVLSAISLYVDGWFLRPNTVEAAELCG